MVGWIKKQSHWVAFLTGILLAFAVYAFNPFALGPEACKAVSMAVLMITWWVTEALPMPMVALIPLVLNPLLGLNTLEKTATAYGNPVIFLFMGGFMIGLAIEKWGLHKRIALSIVKRTGTSGDRIILGFILATGFLSMWLSNTATTMMMFPIAMSVITVMKDQRNQQGSLANFSLVLMLVIAYASNIGGMGTIIGTPPNVAFVGIIQKQYGYTVPFLDWMLLCMPLVIILLVMLFLVLTKWLFPNRIKSNPEIHQHILQQVKSMGKLGKGERRVLVIFLFTALLWITKDLINKTGKIQLSDEMIAVIGALALFTVPSGERQEGRMRMLLDWTDTSRMAWGILLLFGGGIAMAGALEKAGVISQIGNWLAGFGQSGGFTLILVIVFISIFLSEVMSNVAQVIVMAPVLAAMANALKMDPLLLGMPMTLAASAASMMPMGTPPNAIVFGSGFIKMKDMIKAGFVMNLVSIIIIALFAWFLLPLIMSLH